MINRRQNGKHADAIGDEVRRVLRADHAFAQGRDQKLFKIVEYRRVGFLACDQLNQMHVTRRIEEMHAAETMPQLGRKRPGQLVNRQARRIARKNRSRPQMRRDFFVEIRFPVHALGNRLNHDIAFLQQIEVLLVVGGTDKARTRRCRQRTRFELAQVINGFQHIAVGIALFRGQLEQNDFDAGVNQMRGNLRAHDAGAQNGGFANEKRCSWHGYSSGKSMHFTLGTHKKKPGSNYAARHVK